MNHNRPRILVSVFIFNSDENKILIGKKYDENHLSNIGGKLEYGEKFEDCALRILSSAANILLSDPTRLKFICSYNAVDKERNYHIVAVDYFLTISKDEEKFDLIVDPYFFQNWGWYNWEEIVKMHDNLSIGLKKFIEKFGIRNLEDIKSLVSN